MKSQARRVILFGITGLALFVATRVHAQDSSQAVTLFVPETVGGGAVIGTVDLPADRYSLVEQNGPSEFEIDRRTGEIRLARGAVLDFESTNRHELHVQMEWGAPDDRARRAFAADLLASEADADTLYEVLQRREFRSVIVTVMDAPEPPVVANQQITLVSEESRIGVDSASVVARDADQNSQLQYEILAGNESGLLTIDAQTGLLRIAVANTLDAGQHRLPLTVRVSDATGLSDAATVLVDVVALVPPTANPDAAVASGQPAVNIAVAAATPEPGATPSTDTAIDAPTAPVSPPQTAGKTASQFDVKAFAAGAMAVLTIVTVWLMLRRGIKRRRVERHAIAHTAAARALPTVRERMLQHAVESPPHVPRQFPEIETQPVIVLDHNIVALAAVEAVTEVTPTDPAPPEDHCDPCEPIDAALAIIDDELSRDSVAVTNEGDETRLLAEADVPLPDEHTIGHVDAETATNSPESSLPGSNLRAKFVAIDLLRARPYSDDDEEHAAGQWSPLFEEEDAAHSAGLAKARLDDFYDLQSDNEMTAAGAEADSGDGFTSAAQPPSPSADVQKHTEVTGSPAGQVAHLRERLTQLFGVEFPAETSTTDNDFAQAPPPQEQTADGAPESRTDKGSTVPSGGPLVTEPSLASLSTEAAAENRSAPDVPLMSARFLNWKSEDVTSPQPQALAPKVDISQAPAAPPAPQGSATPSTMEPTPSVPPARRDKAVVREELSSLRDVANLHTRGLIAQSSNIRRARWVWIISAASACILGYAGIEILSSTSNVTMRLVGWGMLSSAAVASALCMHSFVQLRRAQEPADFKGELGNLSDGAAEAAAIDGDSAAEPDCMSHAQEQLLLALQPKREEQKSATSLHP